MNNELYHYGVPGMKWGRRKSPPPLSVAGYVKGRIRKKLKDNSDSFKDRVTPNDPISKRHRDNYKQTEASRKTTNATKTARGKNKAMKIIAKIGGDLLSADIVVDGPKQPRRQPFDERPRRGPGGNI